MPKDAHPGFEVVTVKPSPPEEKDQGFDFKGRHIKVTRESVLNMIMFAYRVHPKQIVNAPDWIRSESFDVDGIPDVEGEPDLLQIQLMVQQLLADRFNLHMHRDKRDLDCYALRIAHSGPKIAKSTWSKDAMPHQSVNGGSRVQTVKFTNNSMEDFLLGMQYFVDRPFVDETAMAGRYDFTLQWLPDQTKLTDGGGDPPVLFTAVREQLGLELKAAKEPVDVIVVDSIKLPNAN